jgi:hypothetical protein
MPSKLKKRASKEPYEGYVLPASGELGGSFIDFNKILTRQPVKKIKRKRNEQRRREGKPEGTAIYGQRRRIRRLV